MSDCVFCKIVNGLEQDRIIYEDDRFMAFLSLYPVSTGQILVIPKSHYRWVWDLPDDEIGEYFIVCKKLANHFQHVTGNDRVYSVVLGNEVPHAHIWLVPEVDDTAHGVSAAIRRLQPSEPLGDEEASELVEKLRLN